MQNLQEHVLVRRPPENASENRKGIKSSTVSGIWGIHKGLQKETACGCFSTVIASRKGKLANDKCLESFLGEVCRQIYQN